MINELTMNAPPSTKKTPKAHAHTADEEPRNFLKRAERNTKNCKMARIRRMLRWCFEQYWHRVMYEFVDKDNQTLLINIFTTALMCSPESIHPFAHILNAIEALFSRKREKNAPFRVVNVSNELFQAHSVLIHQIDLVLNVFARKAIAHHSFFLHFRKSS